jgi:hypothetical protein
MLNRFMRAGIVCLAMALMSMLSTPMRAQDSAAKAPKMVPKMVIDAPEHDFGKVKEGDAVSFTFSVKNAGDTELQIVNVSPGCGCTASDFSKTVAPGAKGEITLSVNTSGMNGKQSRYADVISNDKTQPNFKLWVHLDVQKSDR